MQSKTIIFSKDRAMQLDAVFQSFFLHCLDAETSTQVYVIYKASSARHEKQYKRLVMEYPNVQLIKQQNFRRDLLNLIKPKSHQVFNYLGNKTANALGAIGFRTGTRPDLWMRKLIDPPRLKLIKMLILKNPIPRGILFLVDDNIFVEDFLLNPLIETLNKNPKAVGFSLRLGRNTIKSYSANQLQPLPLFSPIGEGIIKFKWVNASHDFGYPLEVSSSLYLDNVILPFLSSLAFHNPNELEAAMASRTDDFRLTYPLLLCFESSVTFCNPINIVQSFHPNRVGNNVFYSANELAEKYDKGERIDVDSYNGFVPNGCHQEVLLKFKKI